MDEQNIHSTSSPFLHHPLEGNNLTALHSCYDLLMKDFLLPMVPTQRSW